MGRHLAREFLLLNWQRRLGYLIAFCYFLIAILCAAGTGWKFVSLAVLYSGAAAGTYLVHKPRTGL